MTTTTGYSLYPDEPISNVVWATLGRQLNNLFWPLIFVFTDINISFNDVHIDILPDFIGWLWIAGAFWHLTYYVPLAPMIRSIVILLAGISLLTWISFSSPTPQANSYASTTSFSQPSIIWHWLFEKVETASTLLQSLFVWLLVGLLIKIVAVDWHHLSAWRRQLNYLRISYVTLILAWIAFPWSFVVASSQSTAMILGIILTIVWLVIACRLLGEVRAVAYFCESNAHSHYPQLPNLQGKESSALENALRPFEGEKRPLHFSLLSLVLLMAVFGLSASQIQLIMSSQEAKEKAREAEKLKEFYRNELSQLYVSDKNKTYAITIPTPPFENDQWEWKVRLPPTGNYVLKGATSQIPKKGYPDLATISMPLQNGTTIIHAELDRDAGAHGQLIVNTLWQNPNPSYGIVSIGGVTTRTDTSSISHKKTHDLGMKEFPYLQGSGSTTTSGVATEEHTQEFAPDETILLLRKLINPQQSNRSTPSTNGGEDGIMFWIENTAQ